MSVRISQMIVLCLCLFVTRGSAQMPTLIAPGDQNAVSLQSLTVDVVVNGSIATTNWTMTFKNNTNRTLEGELNFPLGEGITVSRYALDINGVLREGVPVEKTKATTVLEALETRKIDPGILEKVDGSGFRTRIYPILANRQRIVAVGYDQDLTRKKDNSFQYLLPLAFAKSIDTVTIHIIVNGSSVKPEPGGDGLRDFVFTEWKHAYRADKQLLQFKSARPLMFSIPQPDDMPSVMMEGSGDRYTFLVSTPQYRGQREKALPDNICILWDASLSSRFRSKAADFAFLDAYFSERDVPKVSLVIFSNAIQSVKKFSVKDGDWNDLKNALGAVVPDGATNLSIIDPKAYPCKEFLLFSDGRSTFGRGSMKVSDRPVYTITSSAQSDFPALQLIAMKSGGSFVNLMVQKPGEAVKSLLTQPLMLLGVKTNRDVEEVYPSIPVSAAKGILLAGKAYGSDEVITVQYGYGNEVTLEKKIRLNADRYNVSGTTIERVWAQKKLAELDINYEANKGEIQQLGKRYRLLTRSTSLMVLENLSDYLLYEIEPPEELRAAYDNELKNRRTVSMAQQQDRIAMSENSVNNLYSWWQTDYSPKPIEKRADPKVSEQRRWPSGGTAGIAGTLTDEKGQPLVGAQVTVTMGGIQQGGALTNYDGEYLVKPLDPGVYEVIFRWQNLQQTVTHVRVNQEGISTLNNRLNTALRRDEHRDGAVIISARRDFRPLIDAKRPGGRATISSQTIEKMASTNVTDAASLSSSSVQQRNGSSVSLGGARTTNTQYVVDGVIASGGSFTPPQGSVDAVQEIVSAVPASYGNVTGGTVTIGSQTSGIRTGTSPYDTLVIDELRKASPGDQYAVYLELRKDRMNVPAFYYNVAGFFINTSRKPIGLKILSNLAELDMENYELYKMLGYKLREINEPEAAADAFLKVVQWRSMDPQSLRDYGLALEDAGHYQQALDTLYAALTNAIDPSLRADYAGIEDVLVVEINHLIAKHPSLNTTAIKRSLIQEMPVDVRVVISWNMKNTDIDLWVTDPSGERCMYNHKQTAIGGQISNDFTRGFGPEQFMLRKASSGDYKIEVNYYGDNQVKIVGPTTVMAEIFTRYATGREERKLVALQMKKGDRGGVYFGSFAFR